GGCVRDLLLQKTPKDIDIATAATPEQVAPLFAKTVAVGVSFGVIRVVENEQMLEVASFRKDGNYGDGRHPESITYSSAEEDAQRRDFTINALFLDPVSMEVIDFVGGIEDLKKKCLQTVGLPENRFAEDHLRILRALRFSA